VKQGNVTRPTIGTRERRIKKSHLDNLKSTIDLTHYSILPAKHDGRKLHVASERNGGYVSERFCFEYEMACIHR
jgi:hypothetical protein